MGEATTELNNAIEAAVLVYRRARLDDQVEPALFGIAAQTVARLARLSVTDAAAILKAELKRRRLLTDH